jgi:hypothetical protein
LASFGITSQLILFIYRLKLKRPPTAKKFREDIDELYKEALAKEEEKQNTNPRAKL